MKNYSLISIIALGLLGSCNAIFEKDISAEVPEIIIPTNNDTLISNLVHFKWEEMEGADFYNLQVVSPSFDDIDAFVLDSNINSDEFYQTLSPGNYAYRLRGENGGHASLYTEPNSFFIDSILDLSEQVVPLISPANNIYTNGQNDIEVNWQNLYAADYYGYALRQGADFNSGVLLDENPLVNGTSYTIPAAFFGAEGTYFWGIKASNSLGSTDYINRQINVDLTPPGTPVLSLPNNDFSSPLEDTITFKWFLAEDPGTINATVTSIVEISPDDSFDVVTISFDNIMTDSIRYKFTIADDYWWRVRLVDGVGNEGIASNSNHLIITE